MKKYRLIYTTTCLACGYREPHDIKGMTDSLAEWLREAVKHGDYQHCNGCGKWEMARFSGEAKEE